MPVTARTLFTAVFGARVRKRKPCVVCGQHHGAFARQTKNLLASGSGPANSSVLVFALKRGAQIQLAGNIPTGAIFPCPAFWKRRLKLVRTGQRFPFISGANHISYVAAKNSSRK